MVRNIPKKNMKISPDPIRFRDAVMPNAVESMLKKKIRLIKRIPNTANPAYVSARYFAGLNASIRSMIPNASMYTATNFPMNSSWGVAAIFTPSASVNALEVTSIGNNNPIAANRT